MQYSDIVIESETNKVGGSLKNKAENQANDIPSTKFDS